MRRIVPVPRTLPHSWQYAAKPALYSGIVMGRPNRATGSNRSIKLSKYLSALLLCGLVSQAALAADTGALTFEGAWVRALPPGQPNTAAYLTVTNTGTEGVTIVGGTADIAGSVEIHTTREVDGYQRMEQLSEVALAPGQSRSFSPGGMHLMLLELRKMPAPGDRVQLCFTLAAGEAVCTNAEVRKSAGSQQSHEHHQH